ncbi:MAG: DUF349 domain-containing protein, partial [Steroidobacteraceae bacterium]|nr:DUF349 domain-containing protein [Steroidobacteraceae bacterium]
ELIANTALGDEDTTLRVAAIRLLHDGDALRSLAGLDQEPGSAPAHAASAVRKAAHERLAQLIDEAAIDFNAFCSSHGHRPESMAVAALCRDAARLDQMLACIDDPAVLAKLVMEGPSVRVRQSAAAAIVDPGQLHELLPRVRGKDKAVYKIIRQKCDALLAEQRKAEEAVRESAELCESLEQHAARPHGPLYATTLETLTTRWRALSAHPDGGVEQRGEQAIERCREVIAAHDRELARQAAENEAERVAQQEAREARERALEAKRRAAADQAEAEAHALAEAAAAREAEQHARSEQRAAEAQAHSEVASLIRLSSDALRRGNSRKAARFRQGAEEAMQAAPPLPAHLERHLQQLDEKLNELRQWKDYVVAPKRIELIEEMEALVGSQEAPEALAEHVRALQQEWRTINKGIVIDTSEDGERFQRAFQAAFRPCQDYFASQAAMRRENLEARKLVLERLKAFEARLETDAADYPLVMQVLREAPREWRSHSPVDPDASRPAEIEFQKAMDRLRHLVGSWYERNEADKRALIAQAGQLSSVEGVAQAIDGVKRLQAQWKQTGPVPRDKSQPLWDEFRGLCDAVFQRRDEARALHSAEQEAEKTRAVAQRAAAEQDLRDAEAAESNLLEAARLVRAYERAVMQDASPEERAAMKDTAEAFIAGVRRWPGGGLQALKQAMAGADAAPGEDDAARQKALRMLCIRCEIASSMPTPPEDEDLRRDYQLSLLMTSMGQGRRADDHDWDAMLVEWIAIAAIAPEAHDGLERRFMQCLAKRPTKNSRRPR